MAGCTQTDVELVVSQIWVVSSAVPQLPLQIEDASRPEKSEVIIIFMYMHNLFLLLTSRKKIL